MSTDNQLNTDFNKQSLSDWLQQIEKDLKGKPLATLNSLTADGFTISPAYNQENAKVSQQPFKAMAKWDTVQELYVADAKSANKAALEHLNKGATSLLFYLYGNCDVEVLLKGIQLQYIRTNFVVEGDAIGLAKRFMELIEGRGLNPIEIAGSINIDVCENLARTGNWLKREAADFELIKNLSNLLPQSIRSHCINANLFANAGATNSQQLGIALSMVYEYIHRLELKNSNTFWVNFAIGGDYFGEIAKLRAWRRLWSNLHDELGLEKTEAFIYAETSLRNKSALDKYNNMVRSTAEAMAAVIGGANEISVKGFNQAYEAPSAFGERIAKNQLSILEHESHLNKVRDIAQGAYFIETFTEELATKGWEFFKEIENKGGFIEALKLGWLQNEVEKSASAEQKKFDQNEKVLIGVNKYAKAEKTVAKNQDTPVTNQNPTIIKKIEAKRLSEKLEKTE